MAKTEPLFTTIYGRNLVAELRHFVHRPYLVVTIVQEAGLWYTVADEKPVGEAFVARVKQGIEEAFSHPCEGSARA